MPRTRAAKPTKKGLADADDFVRSITDRWAADGQQITSEETIHQTTLKVAKATAKMLALRTKKQAPPTP